MRSYGIVSPKFWIGKTGKEIRQKGGDAQRVALYLQTSPHASMLGVYYLPIEFICHEVGISTEGASESLRSLHELGFCTYDYANEYVWVHTMAVHQIGLPLKPNDNRVKNIKHLFQELPELSFLKGFYEKYKESMLLDPHHSFNKNTDLNTTPSEAPLETHRSQEQDQEQDQEHINKNNSAHKEILSTGDEVETALLEKLKIPDDDPTGEATRKAQFHQILYDQKFRPEQIMQPKVIEMIALWMKKGVTQEQAQQGVDYANATHGSVPRSPVYYLNFVLNAAKAKQEIAAQVNPGGYKKSGVSPPEMLDESEAWCSELNKQVKRRLLCQHADCDKMGRVGVAYGDGNKKYCHDHINNYR